MKTVLPGIGAQPLQNQRCRPPACVNRGHDPHRLVPGLPDDGRFDRSRQNRIKVFLEFLHQLHQRFPEVLLMLVLDNATIHQSRAVKRFLKQHDWVALEHVEPYSPEYNPIECFWQWRKAKVYGATAFDTIDDVISKVRQLIGHYHEGWLTSTIHFDFTDYQSIL
jgi:transposase